MPTIEVSNETYEKIKDQLGGETESGPWDNLKKLSEFRGQSLFIRTVTYHLVGTVVGCIENFWVLKDVSWVADSGRFQQAIKDGVLSEIEPVGDAMVNIDSITDIFPWRHALPKDQK